MRPDCTMNCDHQTRNAMAAVIAYAKQMRQEHRPARAELLEFSLERLAAQQAICAARQKKGDCAGFVLIMGFLVGMITATTIFCILRPAWSG